MIHKHKLSKSQLKTIRSLKHKKFRKIHGLFVVEGKKSVLEFLTFNSHLNFELDSLFFTEKISEITVTNGFEIELSELKKISFLKNANQVLAVFRIPEQPLKLKENGLILALDDIKDPGNLGTIIRLCDWFGIDQLVCSLETVDCYNPKVIQASMGSLTRVHIIYTNLNEYLKNSNQPIFATVMNGTSIYKENLPKNGIIVMGNEANGISENNLKIIENKLSIPKFGNLQQTESLNVAMATSIILSEFKRSLTSNL